MNELLRDTTWLNTNKLIQEKFGKNLSYRSLKVVSADAEQTASPYYIKAEDLIIPLKTKKYDLGDIIVSRGAYLSEQQKSEVTDLVKLLLQPTLYNMQLKKIELSLTNASESQIKIDQNLKIVELFNSDSFNKQTLSNIILLKSQLEISRTKVAFKIHEMTQRNIFVRLDDIIDSVQNASELKNLDDTTIFINDVQSLSQSSLKLLAGYLDLNTGTNGPLFLVGSTQTMAEISAQEWPESLKKDLLGFYFDIDRVPLSQQDSEEILDLLFFKLDPVLT